MKTLRLLILIVLLSSCSLFQKAEKPPEITGMYARAIVVPYQIPFGQDTLGAAKYKNTNLKNLPANQGQGHFTDTFGDALSLAKAEAAKGVRFIRLHLMWKDAHNFSTKDFPKIVKEAKRVCPTIQQYPGTKWYLSGACEHNLKEKDARTLAELVLNACPQSIYVNTPGNAGATLIEYINEVHGGGKPKSPKYAFSFDGTPAEDSDIEVVKANFPQAEYFMIWGPRYNGRWESNDTTPRPNRTGWPDSKYIKSLAYLATAKGPTNLPNKYLWKSHSENKGNGDARAEKPVLLMPTKVESVVLKQGDTVVNKMAYYGGFVDGRSRYYANKWGYELGPVDIWVKNKKQGTVNAGFRDGK